LLIRVKRNELYYIRLGKIPCDSMHLNQKTVGGMIRSERESAERGLTVTAAARPSSIDLVNTSAFPRALTLVFPPYG
jgi:hypothetical protein